ncbi:MAG: LytTR family transcriptional regulator DNA-binding domain-containing protein [Bacteroidota bacterium]
MLDFLKKSIPFTALLKDQLKIALLLGTLLALILIFLGPFDTDRFQSDYKNWVFVGFGLLFSVFYLLTGRLENIWYRSSRKNWTVTHEALAFITLVLLGFGPIHFYNQVFLNELFLQPDYGFQEYLNHGLWFFGKSLVPIMLAILPFYLFFRNRFGTIVDPESESKIVLSGLNKGEQVVLPQNQILFVKSSENYVDIFFTTENGIRHETFRNTLTVIHEQAPFLKRCHRSYLVNTSNIKTIKGNSQNAKIYFHHTETDIPLSNTYYKSIKSALRV